MCRGDTGTRKITGRGRKKKKRRENNRAYNMQCPRRPASAGLAGTFNGSRAHHLKFQFSFACLKK